MNKINLMLVDDSPVFAQTAKRFLAEDVRLNVLAIASSGMQALERLASDQPDIVLMDLHMPDMDGLEATRRIKALDSLPRIIVISLDETCENRRGALAAGADAFLGKSKIGSELAGLIDRLAATMAAHPSTTART